MWHKPKHTLGEVWRLIMNTYTEPIITLDRTHHQPTILEGRILTLATLHDPTSHHNRFIQRRELPLVAT